MRYLLALLCLASPALAQLPTPHWPAPARPVTTEADVWAAIDRLPHVRQARQAGRPFAIDTQDLRDLGLIPPAAGAVRLRPSCPCPPDCECGCQQGLPCRCQSRLTVYPSPVFNPPPACCPGNQ